MQRILSLPILAILALALSILIVNGSPEINRRQLTPAATNTTTTTKPTSNTTATLPTAGSTNPTTSSALTDKSANTTKTAAPVGAKHSSVGQTSSNSMVTFAMASLSICAAIVA
ncbi:uncharacterized protein MELLADRAFT_123935 [Melampsora larici-populina 98AG31]|uniref:Secreted protein n=1 Tax=Melampsora larici-populina (strain 98AG31 / pathotype 3-4-7) TaxID=747676 RepID=F4RBC6_MELLP|nr:uncharacterized protein MELLADRAFT_123935 [Melampsora larici-populina 98AG31]EGG10383.1 secreted protein [Melampsora larici-populina 98AG31]